MLPAGVLSEAPAGFFVRLLDVEVAQGGDEVLGALYGVLGGWGGVALLQAQEVFFAVLDEFCALEAEGCEV